MQKQNIALRRSVERKVPGYVWVIVALLYAATLLFTILGAMFGILFMPLALGSQTGGSTIRPSAFCGIVGFKRAHVVRP